VLAAAVAGSAGLAVASDSRAVAMAATRERVRRAVRGMRLACVPTSGLQVEILAVMRRRICDEFAETSPRFASTFAD